ncbi:MAG: glucosidase, partial [Bacteroidota bacterium]
AINDYVIHGAPDTNPKLTGTKASGVALLRLSPKGSAEVRVRMSKERLEDPFADFDQIFAERHHEANEFYGELQSKVEHPELRSIQRQAFAGMMWSKQFYYYNVKNWLHGDPGRHDPPSNRKGGRNSDWQHLYNYHVISMPDKWEYPWYAAWDLAFHTIPIARIDPDFAKQQLLLLLNERYQHPNGQIPAYEWNFSDVNPPVHAWAVLRVYQLDKHATGKADLDFLQKAFHKLLVNFTWWINRKDRDGNNLFEGGFLGLDNIGVFDRNHTIIENSRLEQADSTSWMAMFALNMLRMSIDLSEEYPVYQDMCIKFFEHFLYINGAMNGVGDAGVDLWDDEDSFYYDVVHCPEAEDTQMKVRSMVGLIPLYAVETIQPEIYEKLPEFRERLEFVLKERPLLASLVSRWQEEGRDHRHLLSVLRKHRMKKILERMLDSEEFLSEYGIRALSKYHEAQPYSFTVDGETLTVGYLPGESDSSFFGGNSNWRGPIWFPVNYLLLESLLKFSQYYSDDFKLEFPTGSGEELSLREITKKICERMFNIFLPDEKGHRPLHGNYKKHQEDPNFKDHILFYEYFNGDNGEGLGASHQTGWTGLIAEMIYRYYN